MNYTVILHAPPSSDVSRCALAFCQALIESGHQLQRLFLYGDGVLNSNANLVIPRDEIDLTEQWRAFLTKHEVDAVVCIASALKRGILDEEECHRYDKSGTVLAAPFNLSGLGQLVDSSTSSDRIITFG